MAIGATFLATAIEAGPHERHHARSPLWGLGQHSCLLQETLK
jgi:hypothetical protein